eukprot:jgi/Chlat1/8918/Chrsp92S00691
MAEVAAGTLASESAHDKVRVELPLVKVPYESLKKAVRASSKLVEKEAAAAAQVLAEVAHAHTSTSSSSHPLSAAEATRQLEALVSRLQGLKRKLDEAGHEEERHIHHCRARIEHLASAHSTQQQQQQQHTQHTQPQSAREREVAWNRARVSRIVIDYMLRAGYYRAATGLAEAAGVEELVELDVFAHARRVIESLRQRDCGEALAWCNDNRSRLRKLKSGLEFELRVQEFIELVRAECGKEAVTYARKHLSAWAGTHMSELQHAMAALAFGGNTECARYKCLFDVLRWDVLVDSFQREHNRLHCLTPRPLLDIFLQAGLSALKTPFCEDERENDESACSKEDPLRSTLYRQLARGLPYAKHARSTLVCRITNEIMNDNNPPMVLPNGYVYSRNALEAMARDNNGRITCPRTGFTCNYAQLQKAFIS